VFGQLCAAFSAAVGRLGHYLVFEGEKYTAEKRQENTEDLEQAEGLVEDEVVEGGDDDERAVDDGVRDACDADTRGDVGKDDGDGCAEADGQRADDVDQGQRGDEQGLPSALNEERDHSQKATGEKEAEADAESVLGELHNMLEDEQLTSERH
jgi:hypothetical protein